jgi:hypothetical protein
MRRERSRVREESHLEDMRAAIRGDFQRLEERRGEQVLLRAKDRSEADPSQRDETTGAAQEAESARDEPQAVGPPEPEPEPELETTVAPPEPEPERERGPEPETETTVAPPEPEPEPEPETTVAPPEPEPERERGPEPEPEQEPDATPLDEPERRSWLDRLLGR